MHRACRFRPVARRAARAAAFLAIALMVVIGPRTYGAEADPAALAANLTDRMKSDLKLSGDQVGRVEAINLEALRKMQALVGQRAAAAGSASTAGAAGSADNAGVAGSGGDQRATGQALGAIFKERETALRGVLTPNQLQTLQQQRAKWTAALETQAMTMELGLSDEQARKVEAINQKSTKAMQSILSGPPPTLPRQKMARGRQLRAAADERDTALKSVLTAEQWKTFEAKRDERREMFKERMEQNRP